MGKINILKAGYSGKTGQTYGVERIGSLLKPFLLVILRIMIHKIKQKISSSDSTE